MFLSVLYVSLYRWVHFSKTVLFCQPHQQLFTHSYCSFLLRARWPERPDKAQLRKKNKQDSIFRYTSSRSVVLHTQRLNTASNWFIIASLEKSREMHVKPKQPIENQHRHRLFQRCCVKPTETGMMHVHTDIPLTRILSAVYKVGVRLLLFFSFCLQFGLSIIVGSSA